MICLVTLPSEQPDKVHLLSNADFFGLLSKNLESHGGKLAQMAVNNKAQFFSLSFI